MGELDAEEPLVCAEVHVGLVAVVEDEDLAVDVGVHGTGVHVDIRVALDGAHLEASDLEAFSHGAGDQPFAEAAQHPARNKNILRQGRNLPTTNEKLTGATYKLL